MEDQYQNSNEFFEEEQGQVNAPVSKGSKHKANNANFPQNQQNNRNVQNQQNSKTQQNQNTKQKPLQEEVLLKRSFFGEIFKRGTKKFKIFMISLATFVAIVAVAVGAFFIASSAGKLGRPTGVDVLKLNNGDLYVICDKMDYVDKYCFEVSLLNEEGGVVNTVIRTSITNSYDFTDILSLPANYKIRAKVLAKQKSNNGEYSNYIDYEHKIKLQSVTGVVISEDVLYFNTISNTTLTSTGATITYRLVYGVDSQNLLQEITQSIVAGTQISSSFELSSLSVGEYCISVYASCEDYEDSDLSEMLSYAKYSTLDTPEILSFTNGVLRVSTTTQRLKIVINDVYNIEFYGTIGVVNIDLNFYPNQIVKISVQAINTNPYIINSDIATWLIS